MQAQPQQFNPSPVPNAAPEATLIVGGGRRLALVPASLYVQVKNGRDWRVAREIRYGEIVAVYRYQLRDWGYLGLGLLYGLGLITAILVIALMAQVDGVVTGGLVALVALITIGLTAYRIAAVPRRWLRIETHSGPLLLPGRDEAFFDRLAAHLTPPVDAPAPPAPAAIPPAPAPPTPPTP